MAIELGDTVKDSITGYQGIAVSEHRYIHGCRRLGVQPTSLDKDGKPIEVQVFDEPQLILIEAKNPPQPVARTGGPQNEPSRARAGE